MLALEWARQHCGECEHYHGAWQLLRLLGLFNSMRSDDDFLVPALVAEMRAGAHQFLVSGAADYAFLARIAAAAGSLGITPTVTIVDHCRTPLELNQWYAQRANLNVHIVQRDVLHFEADQQYDLVCTHSFLCFFPEQDRRQVAARWWQWLAPGGAVLTAQRARPNETSLRHGYTDEQAKALAERAHRAAAEQPTKLALTPDQLRDLALQYAQSRRTWTVRDKDHLRDVFSRQGFVLEHFGIAERARLAFDIPSTPTHPEHHRWRILARKPAS